MIDSKLLNNLTARVSGLVPADLGVLRKDLEHNIRATVQGAFQRLDLVTREEFDVQAELLARTRARLEVMERRLEELERQVSGTKSGG